MKKFIRITALFLALLMLALPLVGCDKIDEMRAKQGFLLDEDTISFSGETYKRLYTDKYIVLNDPRELYITDKDVPVLLSGWTQTEHATYNTDDSNVFIIWRHPDVPPEVYCRSDKYEYFSNLLEEGIVYDKFCFYYVGLDEEDNEWKDIRYILTDKEKAAIEDIVENESNALEYSPDEYEDIISVSISYCSLDGFFEKNSDIELLVSRTECYILVGEEGDKTIYNVPNKYKSIFDNMLKAFRDSYYG